MFIMQNNSSSHTCSGTCKQVSEFLIGFSKPSILMKYVAQAKLFSRTNLSDILYQLKSIQSVYL